MEMTRLRVKRLEENDVPNIGTLVSPISPKDPTSQVPGVDIQEALSVTSQEGLLCLHAVSTRSRTSRPPLTSTCEVLKECPVPLLQGTQKSYI